MDGKRAAILQELAKLHLDILEEQVKIYHEQVEAYISATGAHPISQTRATAVSTVPTTNWKKYSRAAPSTLPSDLLTSILCQSCNKDGYIERRAQFETAIEAAKRNDFSTTEKSHFAFVLYKTLEKRKQRKREMREVDFKGIRSAYDGAMDMLMEWVQSSSAHLKSDSREQDLVNIVLQLVSKYPPNKQADQQRLAAALRESRALAKSNARQTSDESKTSSETQPAELKEILDNVLLKRRETKKGTVYMATLRANGGTLCQKRSEVECAEFILKRVHNDGFHWRNMLVLQTDQAAD
ncbi:Aste57867_20378 [Aphanomyces stellatus]|uniref:Aste57867_20378 protein n=1 Tax=Aphanomyces stellatus TaxID=120398 RepID=A0A485LFJ0_9STRA|nr:hypothetical protein As57867_020312 [Aphanomyces stellatus]VFT97064.1 Aste57867_20378 [Aphanomyces stellatus]